MCLRKLIGCVFLLLDGDPRSSLAGREIEGLEPREKAVRQDSRVSGKAEQQRCDPGGWVVPFCPYGSAVAPQTTPGTAGGVPAAKRSTY